MRKSLKWLRWAAALLSAVLVAALFPPFNAAQLAWIAIIPLLAGLWTLKGKRRALKGFATGWLAGAVSSAIQFSWLGEVSTVAAVLLPLYLGCFWGLFGAYAASVGNPWHHPNDTGEDPDGDSAKRRERLLGLGSGPAVGPALGSLCVAFSHGAVWAGLEWLRGWLFTGFGWNGLGVAFHETAVIAQSADLIGVAGLSMLLVFFQAVIILTGHRIWQQVKDGKRRSRWDFIAAAVVVALTLAYGLVKGAVEHRRETVRLKALLVQLNIPQDAARMYWDDLEIHQGYENDTLAALESLEKADEKALREAMDRSEEGKLEIKWPDWVIWPESSMRGRLLRADSGEWGMFQGNNDTLEALRTGGDFQLIFGLNELEAVPTPDGRLDPKPGGGQFNSLVTISPDNLLQSYRKNHLVIFGETIPFIDTLPFLKAIYEQQSGAEYGGSFSSGGSTEPLVLPVGATRVGIIPSVCFEDTVPRLERRFVRQGPQVIVNITNDGWFKESVAAAQHFANARFRAIELRRPMLRCANTGVSAAVDHTGSTSHPDRPREQQIIRDSNGSHFTRKSLLVELDVPLKPATTLYALIGDAGVIVLALLGLALSVLTRRHRKPA